MPRCRESPVNRFCCSSRNDDVGKTIIGVFISDQSRDESGTCSISRGSSPTRQQQRQGSPQSRQLPTGWCLHKNNLFVTRRYRLTAVFTSLAILSVSSILSLGWIYFSDSENNPTPVKKKPSRGQLNNKDDETTQQQDGQQQEGSRPRIVFLEPERTKTQFRHRGDLMDDEMLHAPPGEEAAPQVPFHRRENTDGCVPIAEWQVQSFPTCNAIHEIDLLRSAGRDVGKRHRVDHEDLLFFLDHGSIRDVWQLHRESSHDSVVLKSLRMEKKNLERFYEYHRRDAVAMERLTHSPFVVDVYGYCGNSALNELADFPRGLNVLAKFSPSLRGRSGPTINLFKLQVAASIAVGVSHVHGIDGDDRPSMVHHDINPRNVVIMKGGKPKLNDFNLVEFLRIDPKTNRTCGFPARVGSPRWRPPEEVGKPHPGSNSTNTSVMLNEKVDVYALGNLLFQIMTTHFPRGKMNSEQVRLLILRGEPPEIPPPFNEDQDKVSEVFRKAMRMCFEMMPEKRASARQVAKLLMDTLHEVKNDHRKGEKRRRNRPPRSRTFGAPIS